MGDTIRSPYSVRKLAKSNGYFPKLYFYISNLGWPEFGTTLLEGLKTVDFGFLWRDLFRVTVIMRNNYTNFSNYNNNNKRQKCFLGIYGY